MDNNKNIPKIYDSTKDYDMYRDDMNDVFSARYNRFDNRNDYYDYNRYNDRYDRRFDRDYYDRDRYYRYPYCDRYGRCENPMWWLFWPFFFL